MDGALTGGVRLTPANNNPNISVSPFAGKKEICPPATGPHLSIPVPGRTLTVNKWNITALKRAALPGIVSVVTRENTWKGYLLVGGQWPVLWLFFKCVCTRVHTRVCVRTRVCIYTDLYLCPLLNRSLPPSLPLFYRGRCGYEGIV